MDRDYKTADMEQQYQEEKDEELLNTKVDYIIAGQTTADADESAALQQANIDEAFNSGEIHETEQGIGFNENINIAPKPSNPKQHEAIKNRLKD